MGEFIRKWVWGVRTRVGELKAILRSFLPKRNGKWVLEAIDPREKVGRRYSLVLQSLRRNGVPSANGETGHREEQAGWP